MELEEPVRKRYYKPLERPTRFPLELTYDLHICLWSKDGDFKWTIAYFVKTEEGYDLHFVGDRPLASRVRWDHFRELIIFGQNIADNRFAREEED